MDTSMMWKVTMRTTKMSIIDEAYAEIKDVPRGVCIESIDIKMRT